jgi:hypothetical protein
VKRELLSERQQVNFLTADGVKFAHPLHHLGKSKEDLPLIAVDSFRNGCVERPLQTIAWFVPVLRIHDISVWIRIRGSMPMKSQNCRNQGYSYYFCLMIEGSGSGSATVVCHLLLQFVSSSSFGILNDYPDEILPF